MEAECHVLVCITGRDPRGFPCTSCTQLVEGEKYRGTVDGKGVHSQWRGTGCAGMVISPLSILCPRSPRPTQKKFTAVTPTSQSYIPSTTRTMT